MPLQECLGRSRLRTCYAFPVKLYQRSAFVWEGKAPDCGEVVSERVRAVVWAGCGEVAAFGVRSTRGNVEEVVDLSSPSGDCDVRR